MRAALTLAAVLISLAAYADTPLALLEPPQSGLRRISYDQEETLAKYSGRARVTGVLVAQWVRGVDEDEPRTSEYILTPDNASLARLPHFPAYAFKRIDVNNGRAALKAALGAETAARFERHLVERIEVRGTYVITDLIIGVECDSPTATATIYRVVKHDPLALTQPSEHENCT